MFFDSCFGSFMNGFNTIRKRGKIITVLKSEMVEQGLDNIFSRGAEFKSQLGRVFL